MEKITFEQIKEIIITECKAKNACQPEFKKLLAASNETDFWTVIKNNGYWAHNNGVISVELFERYDIEVLKENLIFIDGGTRSLSNGAVAINYNGTVSENNGTVSYNGNNGTVSKNNGTGVVIERQNKKIYIKRNEFEIVYFD